MKKPRSDSKLDALDVDQQRQLCEWLLTPGLSYEAVKKMCLDDFNVSTTASSLSSFYQSYVAAYLIQRRAQAVGVAKELGAEVEKTPGQFSKATIDALEQKAFEFAQNPMVNPKDVKNIFMLVLKAHENQLDRDKFEELKRQAAEAKTTSTDSKLSDAEKAERIREIFKK
ncbi:MAG TPA: hypothetical protein VGK91_00620 [Candidatus Udaeobacter sp.]